MRDSNGFLPAPDVRATVSLDGRIVAVPWERGMLQPSGPLACDFRSERLLGIFDLAIETRTDDGATLATDLTVHDAFRGVDMARGFDSIPAWAKAIGFSRVWHGTEVVALAPWEPSGEWHVECSRCGNTWFDKSQWFWVNVRATGRLPTICPICCEPLEQRQISTRATATRAQTGCPATVSDTPYIPEVRRLPDAA
ncbi:MAG: hypothetical protein ACP5H2_09450 [Solirubrobacteraceae bacterium]